ncbi:MAG: hypothetical protein ACTHJ0_00315 [Flavipsychrobacter sp.]
MIKTSVGELKLSPIKEEGKFVFYNDFITINGKVSKGDRIKIFVDSYAAENGKYTIKAGKPSAELIVRGETFRHDNADTTATVEDYYNQVSELYKQHFYFGKKV